MRSLDWTMWQHGRSSEHGNLSISNVGDHMADPSCKEMFSCVIHIMVKGLDHYSGKSLGTLMPIDYNVAAGQQGQRAQKGDNSFGLDSIATEFY